MHIALRLHNRTRRFTHKSTKNLHIEHNMDKGIVNIYYACMEIVIILIKIIYSSHSILKPNKYTNRNVVVRSLQLKPPDLVNRLYLGHTETFFCEIKSVSKWKQCFIRNGIGLISQKCIEISKLEVHSQPLYTRSSPISIQSRSK